MSLADNDLDLDPTVPVSTTDTPTPATSPLPSPDTTINPSVPGGSVDLNIGSQSVLFSSAISESQEQTRARIAMTFTQVFLMLIIASFIIPIAIFLANPTLISDPVDTIKELTTTIASILAGPFGFVVGFYFKKNTD
jgi:hypothetical protein